MYLKAYTVSLFSFLFIFAFQGCHPKPSMDAEDFAFKVCECAKTSAEMYEILESNQDENTDSLNREARKTFKSIRHCVGTNETKITKGMSAKRSARYINKVIRIVHRECPETAEILSL